MKETDADEAFVAPMPEIPPGVPNRVSPAGLREAPLPGGSRRERGPFPATLLPMELPLAAEHALADVVAGSYSRLAALGRRFPAADPARHGVELLADLAWPGGRLDLWRPRARAGPLPVILYLHGGGFRAMSKDTHWLMGLAFARRGYLVLLPDYRLAPAHPFPAAAEDACRAWAWAAEQVGDYGGDPARMAVAGESAGANLAATVAVASAWARPEPWARAVFEAPHRPRAALPACGILQVSDTARFRRGRRQNALVHAVVSNVERVYLPGGDIDAAMADPLRVVEEHAPARPPPPFFLSVGTWDPLVEDTRRMAAALERHGVPTVARYYPRELHAFQAFVWRAAARDCWAQTFGFLEAQLR